MSHPIRVLWTVPRSVSTSFERMVSERGDHVVFDEPFSRSYYFADDRRSPRYGRAPIGATAPAVLAEIEAAAEERPVFVKDMAYQAATLLDVDAADLLGRFENSFLVRDPAAALRSLARTWPDFTDEETGWTRLAQVADVVEASGRPLLVVDAEQLCGDPAGVVRAWCERSGLEFDADALTWEAGMRPEWELWEDWHESTSRSTGFRSLRAVPPPPGDDEPRLQEAHEVARPVYERLSAVAVTG